MSDANKAVFLSYASQDAGVAKKICEALRQAGVEVWFDQSELVGGDAWDQKIRKQIRECALLIPIISAATQARTEGYFRLEWRLADQRTHLMAKGRPFLLPVVIDDTRDFDAHVPDSFTEVQWTRLPGGGTPAKFAERVTKLLSGGEPGGGALRPDSSAPLARKATPAAKPSRGWLVPVIAGAVLVFGLIAYFTLKPRRSPEEIARIISEARAMGESLGAKAAAQDKPEAVPLTEARKLVAKARELFEAPEVTNRENILLAEQLCDKAVTLDPADAETWAARAQLSYTMIIYGHDHSPARLAELVSDADRAMALAPASIEARLAGAYALARQPSRRAEAVRIYDRLLKDAGSDRRVLRTYAHLLRWQGNVEAAFTLYDRAAGVPGGDPIALADKANSYLFLARFPEAEKAAELSLAQAPTGRAYLIQTQLKLIAHGDTGGARDALEQVPPPILHANRGVNIAAMVWMWRRDPDRCLEFLRDVPQDAVQDIYFTGPKSVLSGRAHALAGHPEAARADWELALRQLDKAAVQDRDTDVVRCELLARLGRREEAVRVFDRLDETGGPAWRKSEIAAPMLLLLLDRRDEAIDLLAQLVDQPRPSGGPVTRAALKLDPAFDAVRPNPRFQALLAAGDSSFAKVSEDRSGSPVAPDQKSVAVLAFANLSDDKGNEYFSDGISEELLNVLAKVPGLKVTARTSSFHFKGKDTPIPEIAKELGVAYVVEGSVRKSGDRVRITAQLIKAADGFHVWSDTFTRDLKDVFAVQDEIAGLIAGNLRAKMALARERATIAPETYALILQGRHAAGRQTIDGAREAVKFYRGAVALSPDEADAWAEMAYAYQYLARFGGMDTNEGMREARLAARKALELDPEHPLGLAAFGWVQRTDEHDWRGAVQSFRHALAVAPGNVTIMSDSAICFLNVGLVDEAVALAARAADRDPLNPQAFWTLGIVRAFTGDMALAEAPYRRAIELAPAADEYHSHLARILTVMNRLEEAKTAALAEPSERYRLAALGGIYFRAGDSAAAERDMSELIAKYGDSMAGYVAAVYAGAGRRDAAFKWLERAYENRDSAVAWVKTSDYLMNLHDDPRWPLFLRKMGLADDQLK